MQLITGKSAEGTEALQDCKIRHSRRSWDLRRHQSTIPRHGAMIAFAVGFGLDKNRIGNPKTGADRRLFARSDDEPGPANRPDTVRRPGRAVHQHGWRQQQGKHSLSPRHETQCNALMMDGHVQTFDYKKSDKTCDMLRQNITVTP